MSGPSQTAPRPVGITVICVLGFIGTALLFPYICMAIVGSTEAWMPPYLIFIFLAGLVCMMGLWQMRKWSVFLYTAFMILNQVIMLRMGIWNIFALLLPAIVIAICFANLSKMR